MTTFYEENGLYKPLGEQPSLNFDGGQIRKIWGKLDRLRELLPKNLNKVNDIDICWILHMSDETK